MKKFIIGLGTVILLAIAGRAFWAYQQVKPIEQNVSIVENKQNSNMAPVVATTTVAQEEEVMMTGGNNAGPDCQYETLEAKACKRLEIDNITELSNDIKNSTYIVAIDSKFEEGWHHSYFIGQPILGVRFLGVAQYLIKKETYNKIFLNNVINDKTSAQNFSVHCSDDKTTLPTVSSRYCYNSDQDENSHLFNFKGDRLMTVAELRKNLINQSTGDYPQYDINSLKTIARLKNNTTLLFDQGNVFIPTSIPLEKIQVVYSGFIDGNKLMPKDKIEEISYFKDGSSTTIK